MPLYELFCLARPQLAKAQLAEIMRVAARTVMDQGGVVTDLRSFGDRQLAYEIRKPGAKWDQAAMWQLTFAAPPGVLGDIDHSLRIDERVLRWMVLKRRPYAPLPTPFRIARAAESVAAPLAGHQLPGAAPQAL